MRTLEIPDVNLRDLEKTIYYINDEPPKRVKNTIVSPHYNNILDRYQTYNIHKNRLENIPISVYTKENNEVLYDNLFNLYDSKESLKTNIRNNSGVICPYCGIAEDPFHVDHFLPRSKFPEFSIYNNNLIAACASCNSRYKGSDFVVGGVRQFFNPYFDQFLDSIQFLNCSLTVLDKYLLVEFFIDDSIQSDHPYEYQIIKNHFENLNLESRYNNLIIKEVFRKFKDEYIDPITKQFDDIELKDIKKDIQKKLRGFHTSNNNHWEKVFWNKLVECDNCLNLIVNKIIPFD